MAEWFVIVNPVSGFGYGLKDFPLISKLLRDNHISCDAVFTEHHCHATELTVEAVKNGYRKIIVVGGDGTLNEVVNGLFIQKVVEPKEVLIAVIAIGTGNDWVKTFGISPHYTEAIRAIKEGYCFLQDVGAITYTESSYRQTRYMVNVAGLGFDAKVVSIFNHFKLKGYKGSILYPSSILRAYRKYRSSKVKITIDDKPFYTQRLFSLAAGVCKFNGGGILQLPKAIADDGLLDITIVKPIHWWHIIFRMGKLTNGKIYEIGHVIHAQGSHICIESDPDILLEADGELYGGTPVDIQTIPRAIRVVVSKEFLNKQ